MNGTLILKDFQKKAIEELKQAFDLNSMNIVLKSCTGSGKTIILTSFIDDILNYNRNLVFVWLTPGQGELEEQSRAKMVKYIPDRKTKDLSDIMLEGFSAGDTCFVNWELLVSKSNIATQEGDFTNIYQHIMNAKNRGLDFVIIIDEEHLNKTPKAKEIVATFNPLKIISASATPKADGKFALVNINEEDVINEELIKKKIVINLDVEDNIRVENQVEYLLDKALKKRDQLQEAFNKESREKINPLIIVQLPNDNEVLLDAVESFFEKNFISYENELLAVWLHNKKINNEDIEKNDHKSIAMIFKQAVSTGWDCPRAQILVKLRDNMDDTFEIQTIGRIRRMPEAKFYNNDIINYCYLYTFDSKYVEKVKKESGNYAIEAATLLLNEKYDLGNVNLMKELKSPLNYGINSKVAWQSISSHYKGKYGLSTRCVENKKILETKGYLFEPDIVKNILKGSITRLDKQEFKRLKTLDLVEPMNTHIHGQQFQHVIGELAKIIHIQYDEMRVIVRRLFDEKVRDDANKILSLDPKELYSFFINNFYLIKQDVIETLSDISIIPMNLTTQRVKKEKFNFPKEYMLTYDPQKKIQRVYSKNLYVGYLSSAEPRSSSEARFEKFCENSDKVKWFYKNGDKGLDYFSIVYIDSFEKQRLFYPDYIVMDSNDRIWIFETKGGFTRSGSSEDIDKFSKYKFEVLKSYLKENDLLGGFVRLDKSIDELCVCLDEYNDNPSSSNWKILEEVL